MYTNILHASYLRHAGMLYTNHVNIYVQLELKVESKSKITNVGLNDIIDLIANSHTHTYTHNDVT